MKIKELMNKIYVISPNTTLKTAADVMSKKNIGSLAIVDKKKIVGIITERDILCNAANLNKKISSAMTEDIISIDLNESIEEAAKIMSDNQIKRILVTEKDKLVGIITATDIIANSDLLNQNIFF